MALTAAIIVMAATFYGIVEGWTFIDAMFFSVATISTVGYGDMVPETVAGRVFPVTAANHGPPPRGAAGYRWRNAFVDSPVGKSGDASNNQATD